MQSLTRTKPPQVNLLRTYEKENAFRRFEAMRKERTTRIQQISRANTWLSGRTNADWVYGYDTWTVPLAA